MPPHLPPKVWPPWGGFDPVKTSRSPRAFAGSIAFRLTRA